MQWDDKPLPDLPQEDIPLIYQFAWTEEERQLFKLHDQAKYLRTVLGDASGSAARSCHAGGGCAENLRDPDLIAEAERSKLTISPISGARLRSIIGRSFCLNT